MIVGQSPYPEDHPYELLEIPQDADRKAVNTAYRAKMKSIKMQDERFQKVQQAKEALTKPAKRMLVDLLLPARSGDREAVIAEYGAETFAADARTDPATTYLLSDLNAPRYVAELPAAEFLAVTGELPPTLGDDPILRGRS